MKKRLLKKYKDKTLEDVVERIELKTESGSFYLIQDKTSLKYELIDPEKARSKIILNLRLIYGIGNSTEIVLKKQGFRTIEDLLSHDQFGRGRGREKR